MYSLRMSAYVADPERAAEEGRRAREVALGRYGLQRFLDDWDRTLHQVSAREVTA